MSANTVAIKLKINFPVVLFTVLAIHVLFLLASDLNPLTYKVVTNDSPTVLKIRQVKTAKIDHPNLKLLSSAINKKDPSIAAPSPLKSLRDLVIPAPTGKAAKTQRPGTRPEIVRKTRTLESISLNGSDFKKSYSSPAISTKSLSGGGSKLNDAVVSIEVPEGIEPDELNKYELMFYGFQKRTAMAYANSILTNLDKFSRRYPNFKLNDNQPKIVMTARITYDDKGNVKQIKMIRWTHLDEVQNFFEDVVKNMDQLHNPPKALWEAQGEFSMFFTLEIVNG